ncbi:MAG: hypothetical protein ACREYE_06155 [Gammaproteobacteria bacterium]
MNKSAALGISCSGGPRDPHVFHYTLRLLVPSLGLTPSGLRSVSLPAKRSCAPAERDLPSLATVFSQTLSRRDQWIRHLRAASERALLEEALKEEICLALRRAKAAVPPASKAAIVEVAQYAAANLRSCDSLVPIAARVALTELPPLETEALPQWRGIAALLLTKEGPWRRSVTVQDGFPAPGFGTEADRAGMIKDKISALLEELRAQAEPLRCALEALRHLPPPAYTDSQWMTTQALFELLRLGLAHLALVFGEQKKVDFAQLALAALRALGEPEAPTAWRSPWITASAICWWTNFRIPRIASSSCFSA